MKLVNHYTWQIECELNENNEFKFVFDEETLQAYQCEQSGLQGETPIAMTKPTTVKQISNLIEFSRGNKLKLQPISLIKLIA